MVGRPQKAQPEFEYAWRNAGTRTAEAGYWFALNALHLGDEVGAMRRFELVALRHANDLFGKRAHANVTLGPDDRPIGAAFAGFEGVRYLPESAYQGMPKDTTWNGAALEPKAMARQALEFLLAQQHDDGGFTDARYAYWPSSEITPNVWVAITAIAMTALWEYRPCSLTLVCKSTLRCSAAMHSRLIQSGSIGGQRRLLLRCVSLDVSRAS